jgi:hypothetical protein
MLAACFLSGMMGWRVGYIAYPRQELLQQAGLEHCNLGEQLLKVRDWNNSIIVRPAAATGDVQFALLLCLLYITPASNCNLGEQLLEVRSDAVAH